MNYEQIDALWEEYKRGPDFDNVKRWFDAPTLTNTEGYMAWLFRSAILCATDPDFLRIEECHSPAEHVVSEDRRSEDE